MEDVVVFLLDDVVSCFDNVFLWPVVCFFMSYILLLSFTRLLLLFSCYFQNLSCFSLFRACAELLLFYTRKSFSLFRTPQSKNFTVAPPSIVVTQKSFSDHQLVWSNF